MANTSVFSTILQSGHGNIPVLSAALLPSGRQLATLDENGKIVFWDIRSGKQADEILFQDWERAERLSGIETLPGKPTKLRVQGNRLFAYGLNALYIYSLKEKAARLEFIGESEECLKTSGKRPRSIPTYDRPDNCRDITKPGQLSQENKHYAFLARFEGLRSKWGELMIAEWSRPETKQYYLYTSSDLLNIFAAPSDIAYNDAGQALVISKPQHCYRFVFSQAKDDNVLPRPQVWENPEAAPSEQDRSRYALHWLSPSADTVIWRNHRNELVQTTLESEQDEILFRLEEGPGVYRRLWADQEAGVCVLEKAADGQNTPNGFEVYDLITGALVFARQFDGEAHHLLTFNRNFLVTRRGKAGHVHLWNIREGQLFRTFGSYVPKVTALESSGDDNSLHLILRHKAAFKVQMGETFETRKAYEWEEEHHQATMSKDGKLIASINESKREVLIVKVWEKTFLIDQDHLALPQAEMLAFSSDGRRLAIAAREGLVRIIDTSSEETITAATEEASPIPDFEISGPIHGLAFHPDEPWLAIAHGEQISVFDWEKKGGALQELRFEALQLGAYGLDLTFSPTGKYLLLRSDEQVELFECDGWKQRFPKEGSQKSEKINPSWFTDVFSSSTSGPAFIDQDESLVVQVKGEQRAEIWDIGMLEEQAETHQGHRAGFSARPQHTISFEHSRYDSFLVLEKHRLIVLFKCKEEGFMLARWEKEEHSDGVSAVPPAATFFPVDETDFIVLDAQNYYYTSSNGYRLVAFKKGEEIYPADQFGLLFNRPDKVLENIGLSSEKVIDNFRLAFQNRLDKAFAHLGEGREALKNKVEAISETPEDIEQLDLPGLSMTVQGDVDKVLGTVAQPEVELRLSAPGDIRILHLHVNGVPVFSRAGKAWAELDVITGNDRSVTLPLSNGLNKVQASVVNSSGAESILETRYLTFNGQERQPTLYLIGIGVGDHNQKNKKLDFPPKDIKDLSEALQAIKGKSPLKRAVLFDNEALDGNTVVRFLEGLKQEGAISPSRQFEESLASCHVDDQVIIAYAGHGVRDSRKRLILSTFNMDFSDPDKRDGLPYEELERFLDGIPARNRLILIDACNSGEVSQPAQDNPEAEDRATELLGLMKAHFADIRRGHGATVLAGAQGWQDALEGGGIENGIVTRNFINALEEGHTRITSLLNQVIRRVPGFLMEMYLNRAIDNLTKRSEEQKKIRNILTSAVADELSRDLPRKKLEQTLIGLVDREVPEIPISKAELSLGITREFILRNWVNKLLEAYQKPTLRSENISNDWEIR